MAAYTGGQRFLEWVLPRGVFESLEAGTRTFALACPCGHVRDLWEAGGVKSEGTEKLTYARCTACGKRTWQRKRKKTPEERRSAVEQLAQRGLGARDFMAAHVWWFTALVWAIASVFWSLPLFLVDGETNPWGFALVWLPTFIIGWAAGPWFWFTTRYRISRRELTLFSGPFRMALDLRRIQEVRQKRQGLGLSFATHTDTLWVGYPMRAGGAMISPKERGLFLSELARACPHLVERNGELVSTESTT